MFGNYYKTNEYYAGSISFVDENGRTEDYRFTQEELDAVMEAVQKDVEAGNMTDYQLYSLRAGDEDNTYRIVILTIWISVFIIRTVSSGITVLTVWMGLMRQKRC